MLSYNDLRKKMQNITTLFPKHVYCKDNVCVEHLCDFKDRLLEVRKERNLSRDRFLNVDTSHRVSDYNIKDDKIFQPLINEIRETAFNFACFVGYGPERAFMMELTNVWFNFSDEHDYNWPHIHPGSIISGAYYIENEIETNSLTFFDHYSSLEYPINDEHDHWWSSDRSSFDCKKGRLLMFKSDFLHGNTPQVGKGQKITLSFNIK